jgi:hypothetical protein
VEVVEQKSFKCLPAKPGICAMCARDHDPAHAHDVTSLFYGVRFKLKWKRDPTWADACAHLTPDQRAAWREALETAGQDWTEPEDGEPIREPYAMSDPFRKDL